MFVFNTSIFSIYINGSFCWLELESTLGKTTRVLQFFNKRKKLRVINYFDYKEA